LAVHAQVEGGTATCLLVADVFDGFREAWPARLTKKAMAVSSYFPQSESVYLTPVRTKMPLPGATSASSKPLSAMYALATLDLTRKSPATEQPSRNSVG
jgi:hypothetical protein